MKLEMKGEKSQHWIPTTLENFLEMLEITRTIIEEGTSMKGYNQHLLNEYKDSHAIWSIKAGKTVETPVTSFRLAEGTVCPKCGAKFIDVCGALSRRDNKTKICSPCGTQEAIEDMAKGRVK